MNRRIAHISTPFLPVDLQYGGATQRRVRELAHQQYADGDEVTVVGPFERNETANHSFRRDHVPAISSYAGLPAFLARAERHLRSFEPDVVHIHSVPLAGLLPRRCPRVLQVDFSSYGAKVSHAREIYRSALNRMDAIAPVSEHSQRLFEAQWPDVQAPKRVLPNGCAMPAIVERTHTLPLKAGYLGRICRQKGSHILGEAASLAAAIELPVEFLAAGPTDRFSPHLGESASQTTSHPLLGEHVRYLGVLSEADRERFLNEIDVIVLPTVEIEMFGMAIVEGMAHGAIPLGSNHGGIPEVVGDDFKLFTSGEPQELVEGLSDIASAVDAGAGPNLSSQARDRALNYSWRNVADKCRQIYEEVGS